MNIKLENVNYSYTKDPFFKDINLEIKNDEFVAILGHNGSGKSTLAKIIMGLIEINSGNIYINDVLMTEDNIDELRKDMAIIFQNPDNQFVGATVKDDIAFGLENHNISRKEMIEKINYYSTVVNMENFLNKNPEELSGGQKQRVAIAGALAMETDLIIFDEATSMLDPKGTNEINNVIKDLSHKVNKTIISITHNIEEALYADKIIVMTKGKIEAVGTPKEILSNKELLTSAGLKLIDSISIINDLKDDDKYKDVVEALWELTFNI